MTHRVHNFSAGPAALPLPVLEQAQSELLDFRHSGMSVMEMSHRGKIYDQVHNEAIADLRTLLGASDDYAVIFMGGGARTQFALVPTNLLAKGAFAEYVVTGTWAEGALKEAKKLGDARSVYSSADSKHDHVPASGAFVVDGKAAYLHYTSNNTIFGTQFHYVPNSGAVPLVCDMSSDILSQPVEVNRYAVIYAGAQKNMGPAGVTVALIHKDLLKRSPPDLPEMWSYAKIADKNSLLNTPPVFPIYVMGLVIKHLLKCGGLPAQAARNSEKAELLYATIDASGGFYRGHAKAESRSQMNVTFRLPSPELEADFVEAAKKQGLEGLKGHRSVGGIRASIYNAVELSSVQALVSFMKEFLQKRG